MIWAVSPHPQSPLLQNPRAFSASRITPLRSPGGAASRVPLSFVRLESRSKRLVFRSFCTEKSSNADGLFEEFSVLPSEVPWDIDDVWTTFAAYFFILHVPLSYGGLSVVAQVLHEQNLDPVTIVVSSNVLQVAEFVGSLMLFNFNARPQNKFPRFYCKSWFAEERSWIGASITGLFLLALLVLLTSFVADALVGPKDVNNPVVRELLSASPLSASGCFISYCITAPLLEESVYRGFLLSTLATTMKWWQAVIISSLIFSIGHFSGENFLQLFLIGCVLGSAYCWTSSLASCFTIHAVYNAMILLLTNYVFTLTIL